MAKHRDEPFDFPGFRGARIADLIGRPLVAIAKANEMMALEQVKLLLKICFQERDGVYKPVMVEMTMTRGFIDTGDDEIPATIDDVQTTFFVPLISLISISTLAIDEADIEFDMDVHTQYEIREEFDDALSGDDPSSGATTCELAGSVSYDSRSESEKMKFSSSRSASMSINVSAGNLPLPLGVSTLVQAFTNAIYPAEVKPDGCDK